MGTNKRQLFTSASLLAALVLSVGLVAGTGLAQNAQPVMLGDAVQAPRMGSRIGIGSGMQAGLPLTDTAMCPGRVMMGGTIMHGGRLRLHPEPPIARHHRIRVSKQRHISAGRHRPLLGQLPWHSYESDGTIDCLAYRPRPRQQSFDA